MSKGRWGKRRLNAVSWARNPRDWYYVYGSVGTCKNQVVTTLAARRTREAILKVFHKYESYIGELMSDVPRDRGA